MPALYGAAFAATATLMVIAGDVLIKSTVDRGLSFTSVPFLTGCALYAVSGIGWFLALHHMTLGQAAVAFSMFSLIALCAAGVLLFGERLYMREYIGIGMAVGSMVLMVRIA